MVIIVSLKTDNSGGGSAKLCCSGIEPDPLLASHVVLKGITGLSWPFSGAWVNVKQWSVPRDTILNWMVGPVQSQPSLTVEILEQRGQDIPHLPGTLPSEDMANNTADMQALVASGDEAEKQAALAAQAAEAIAKGKKGAGSKESTSPA